MYNISSILCYFERANNANFQNKVDSEWITKARIMNAVGNKISCSGLLLVY